MSYQRSKLNTRIRQFQRTTLITNCSICQQTIIMSKCLRYSEMGSNSVKLIHIALKCQEDIPNNFKACTILQQDFNGSNIFGTMKYVRDKGSSSHQPSTSQREGGGGTPSRALPLNTRAFGAFQTGLPNVKIVLTPLK